MLLNIKIIANRNRIKTKAMNSTILFTKRYFYANILLLLIIKSEPSSRFADSVEGFADNFRSGKFYFNQLK